MHSLSFLMPCVQRSWTTLAGASPVGMAKRDLAFLECTTEE